MTTEDNSVVDNPGAEDTPEIVAEAKEYGWVEQDKFRGDAKEWVPAHEFVKRGRNSVPILRSKLSRLEAQLASVQSQYGMLAKDAQEAKAIGYRQAEAEWKQKLAALKAQKLSALEQGDHERVVEIDEAIDATKDAKPTPPAQQQQQAPQGVQPSAEEQRWLAENPWYTNNPMLKLRADAIGIGLAQQGKSGKDLLDGVSEMMAELFPEEVGAEPRARPMTHSARTRSGAGTTKGGGGRTYDDLPPDAKAACDRMVARKMATREEYVKYYQWD